jgi:uncharacterized repeat protein (TIGR01451 family)
MSGRLRIAVLGVLGVLAVLALPAGAHAQVVRNFTPRYSGNLSGDITLIGNTLMSCSGGGTCTNARNGTGGSVDNNDFTMQYVDVDGVGSTFNSSRATLTLPAGATVLWAGLYWGGDSNHAQRNQAVFTTPTAASVTLNATQLDAVGTRYHGFVDVTARVLAGGSGTYTVANVRTTTDANMYAGWGLVVVYRDLTLQPRNLVVFDGYAHVAPGATVTINVTGFQTPPAGAVNTRLGVLAYEGDRGLTGDSFRLNATNLTDAVNPATNFYNSTVSMLGANVGTKNPNYINQLGFDIDLVNANGILPNGATSASITLPSTDDRYYPGVVTFSTELYAPVFVDGSFTKTVADLNAGVVAPGDVLEYTLALTNAGNDGGTQIVMRDTLPANATYVPGSIVVASGPNTGAKTDAAGDDQAEFAAASRVLTVRLGTGANAASGGSLAPGAATSVRFRVRVNDPLPHGTVVSNQAGLAFNGQQTGTLFQTRSDATPATSGQQPTTVTVTAGVLVTGFGYADVDHDAVQDVGEVGTAVPLFVKLIAAAVPTTAYRVSAVDPVTGGFALLNVDAGAYTLVLDTNALVSDVTPTYPAGWVGTEAPTGARAVTVAAVSVSGQSFGMWNGGRVDGVVFRDHGAPSGVPNDGVRNGAEPAIAGVRVTLRSPACPGGACDSTLTNAAGAFTVWFPATAAGAVTVVETNPAAHRSTGGSAGTTGGSYDRTTDVVSFTAVPGTAATGLAFGDVPLNTFVANGASSAMPGATASYPHVFTAGSAGNVAFSVSQVPAPVLPGWAVTLIRDLDCDGIVDPGEPVVAGTIATTTGATTCLVLRHTTPPGAPDGVNERATITAGFVYVNASPALSAADSVADLTTVTNGSLEITKSVDLASARPGDLLTYTITYRNPGTSPVSAIAIHDVTPDWTVFEAATCALLGPGLTGCSVSSAPAVGASGTVHWSLAGALAPGGQGSVTLQVRIVVTP